MQEPISKSSETTEQPQSDLKYKYSLWTYLKTGRKERARFVESQLNKYIAFQIRAMRADREWSQGELAQRTEMNQNMIYRLENPSYGRPTLSTLKRIAAAFDVALIVRFIPFKNLVNWISGTSFTDSGLSPETMAVQSFDVEIGEMNPSLGPVPMEEMEENVGQPQPTPVLACMKDAWASVAAD